MRRHGGFASVSKAHHRASVLTATKQSERRVTANLHVTGGEGGRDEGGVYRWSVDKSILVVDDSQQRGGKKVGVGTDVTGKTWWFWFP